MSIAFEQALNFVLKHEGGYVNHPSDPGGETKYGISKRAYPNVDIANLTMNEAAEIYRRDYWDKLPNGIPDQLKFMLFDFAINAGINRAIKTLQKAIRVNPDGVWGSGSSAALSKMRVNDVIFNFTLERQMFYAGLSTFQTFGKGWTKRTLEANNFAMGAA
jgi:lysozyme family protein